MSITNHMSCHVPFLIDLTLTPLANSMNIYTHIYTYVIMFQCMNHESHGAR